VVKSVFISCYVGWRLLRKDLYAALTTLKAVQAVLRRDAQINRIRDGHGFGRVPCHLSSIVQG